jgi:excisionase family DNA binding protein
MAQFLTVRQVAERLNMHSMSVYKLLQSGSLPAIKVGKRWKIDAVKLEQWVNRGSPSASPAEFVAPNLQVIFLDLATSPRTRAQTYVVALPDEAGFKLEAGGPPGENPSFPDPRVLLACPVDPATAQQLLAQLPVQA